MTDRRHGKQYLEDRWRFLAVLEREKGVVLAKKRRKLSEVVFALDSASASLDLNKDIKFGRRIIKSLLRRPYVYRFLFWHSNRQNEY